MGSIHTSFGVRWSISYIRSLIEYSLALRNIFEQRYGLTELNGSTQAAYLLAGSVILYPIVCFAFFALWQPSEAYMNIQCGYMVDTLKHRPIVLQLLMLSSCLTLACYLWLALPPWLTQTAIPAIVAFGFGYGFSPCKLMFDFQLELLTTDLTSTSRCHRPSDCPP